MGSCCRSRKRPGNRDKPEPDLGRDQSNKEISARCHRSWKKESAATSGEVVRERLCSWRSASKSGSARRAAKRQHIFTRQQLYRTIRNRHLDANWRNSGMTRGGCSHMRQAKSLTSGRMNDDSMLHQSIDGSNRSSTSARPARSLYRNVRIVDAGVMHHHVSMQYAHKAQKIQSGEDNAK